MASTETKVQREFDKLITDALKSKINVPRFFSVIGTQIPLYSAVQVLTKDTSLTFPEKPTTSGIIGRIDVIFKYKSTNYICEIKDCFKESGSFWYATKALAYTEYYKWQVESNDFKPAVLIPLKGLKLEHQLIAGRLDIKLFIYSIQSDGMINIKPVDDTPYWKQNLNA